MASAQRTALRASCAICSWSRAGSGTPKTAMMASPMYFSTTPWWAMIAVAIASMYSLSQSIKLAGSILRKWWRILSGP